MKPRVPDHKFDFDAVESLVDAAPEVVWALVNELLVWLQDPNWPVFKPLVELMVGIPADRLSAAIRPVLEGTDSAWKRALLEYLLSRHPTATTLMMADLRRLAEHPTAADVEEGVPEAALRLLR